MLNCAMLTYNTIEIVPDAVLGISCMHEVSLIITEMFRVLKKMVSLYLRLKFILRLYKPDCNIPSDNKNIFYLIKAGRKSYRFFIGLLQ